MPRLNSMSPGGENRIAALPIAARQEAARQVLYGPAAGGVGAQSMGLNTGDARRPAVGAPAYERWAPTDPGMKTKLDTLQRQRSRAELAQAAQVLSGVGGSSVGARSMGMPRGGMPAWLYESVAPGTGENIDLSRYASELQEGAAKEQRRQKQFAAATAALNAGKNIFDRLGNVFGGGGGGGGGGGFGFPGFGGGLF